jgi:antagonist of KipI
MSTPTFEIIEPGIFTTVQDRGRYGYQRYGVPVSGAMDEFALRAANLLVGNDQGAAGLEMTVLGPGIRFLTDTWIAVTGADLSPQLDGKPLPGWQTVEAPEGGVLSFHGMKDGMRAYLAVAGGIDVPIVMGSRSTYVKGAIGGLEGRPLSWGDVVSTLPTEPGASFVPRRLPEGYEAPSYGEHHELRVILGPQHRAFGPEALSALWSSSYVISLDSDRMGFRLEGPSIAHQAGPDIVSDGSPPGAIQVAGDGIPTILMADRGTTGGYTKIATVISADIGRLAQGVPGQSVAFKPVTVEEAHQVLREGEAVLSAIEGGGVSSTRASPKLSILVDGEAYEVESEDGEVILAPHPTEGAARTRSHRASATVDGHTYEFEVEVQRED